MGYIKESCKDKILETTHIEEVIGDFIELKRAGANFKGSSPFTEEKTPSFMVSPARQMFKCFSTGKGGNAISFLMERGMSYPEALEHLAKKYNIQIEYEAVEFSEKKVKQLEEKDKLRKVLKLVHDLYVQQYHNSTPEHPCRKEVEGKREYSKEKIIDWGIGFAPENFIYDKLKSSGYQKEGEALGLIHVSERGNKFDKYSNRVVYPIHDRNGLLIGLAGRDIAENSKMGKWINPPVNSENILYNKSRVFYGLHKAKMEMRRKSEVYIVEGYNDVIAFHSYGVENTVAPCGTAITDEQINELKKYCEKVIFCMDPDKAGVAAVLKHIPKFIKQGFRVDVLTLDLDPDDFVRKYHDVIALSGLDAMLNVPGVRVDGFQLLINEYIRKDYHQLELDLKRESERLTQLEVQFKNEKQNLLAEVTETEGNLLEAKSFLKELELAQGKKSEEYTEQAKTCATLKANLDTKKHKLKNFTEPVELKQQKNIVSNTKVAYEDAFQNSELRRSVGAKHLSSLIIDVKDKAFFEIYFNWIATEAKVLKSTLNMWIKEFRSENEDNDEPDYEIEYELPKNVKIPFKELESDIKHYGMFMANNQIWMSLPEGRDGKVFFQSMSNFEIEILQHMQDEKFPMKLIRIKNVHGLEKIFDTPSENLNTPQAFDNMITGHSNFRFDGNRSDLLQLRRFLFDKMGNGRKIEVLGWQPDGKFFAWNNKITTENGESIEMNEHGIFIKDDVHYYIPSANQIYKNNSFKYDAQKRFRVIQNPISFDVFALKVKQVHRDHAISSLLFGIASIFQDIVVEKLSNFPILFFYGPGSSGKDELSAIVQSFTGVPQTAINLEGQVSTIKAQVREFAQFRNGISQLSEYKAGNPQLDGMLKALWDRRGYKRGNLESHVGTESIPIESSAILTGNQFPNEEPLILRLIWNEMTKNEFNPEEMKAFDELRDMREKGVSGYSDMFLAHRIYFQENFEREQRSWKGILQELFPDAKSRIISNLSILSSVYNMFKDKINFPFTQEEMIQHFRKGIDQQIRKINSASILNRFWDCFIAALRGQREQRLQVNYIVTIKANNLYMNWSHTYNRIQLEWITRYKELAPTKPVIREQLEKSGCFIEDLKVFSFDEGRDANRTSAMVINLNGLSEEIKQDIIGSVMYQMQEGTLFDKSTTVKEPTGQEALPLDAIPDGIDDGVSF